MKHRDIQRSVRAQRVDRAEGDAPSIGRVGRVPGTGLSKGTRRRKKRGESGRGARHRNNRRKVMITWSVVFMLIALGTVALCVMLWVKPNSGGEAISADGSLLPPGVQKRVESEFVSPPEDESLAIVKKAMRIQKASEVDEFFRVGKGGAAQVIGFLNAMEDLDGKVDGYEWLSSMDANGMLLEGVVIRTRKDDRVRNRLALLTPDERGRWRVDFDAFARVVEPSWDQVMKEETPKALVRVITARDSYYNGTFASDADWDCYGLASPDHEEILIGYARKGSPQSLAMARIMDDGTDVQTSVNLNRAVLEIRRVEGATSRQFEISRVLAQDWVMGDTPFDEGFK
ncbi:MAG: hypothetical protein MUF13_15085 [Akkermansiaceae bacterium]|jgi:hypothetical protein|nr:hypothetical protein [Akkermansiaceae bacterium]